MVRDFIIGATKYLEAFSIARRYRLMRYFFYSGLVGLLVLGVMAGIAYSFSDNLASWLDGLISWDIPYLDSVLTWVSGGIISLLFFILYKHLILIATAPIMSALSWQVEKHLVGAYNVDDRTKVSTVVKEVLRGAQVASRNVIRELGYTVLLLLASLVPGGAIITTPMIFLVQGFYAGFGNHDFWAERHLSYGETVRYMRAHKPMLTGNGLVFLAIIAIPFVGVILGPPLATIAATSHAVDVFIDDQYE